MTLFSVSFVARSGSLHSLPRPTPAPLPPCFECVCAGGCQSACHLVSLCVPRLVLRPCSLTNVFGSFGLPAPYASCPPPFASSVCILYRQRRDWCAHRHTCHAHAHVKPERNIGTCWPAHVYERTCRYQANHGARTGVQSGVHIVLFHGRSSRNCIPGLNTCVCVTERARESERERERERESARARERERF